jgi:hypothetical protein
MLRVADRLVSKIILRLDWCQATSGVLNLIRVWITDESGAPLGLRVAGQAQPTKVKDLFFIAGKVAVITRGLRGSTGLNLSGPKLACNFLELGFEFIDSCGKGQIAFGCYCFDLVITGRKPCRVRSWLLM